ncbi:uncharacterized protein LOC143548083 [Bidens hawaiensis]|uniref:uncharacterized protein LOC143548083 n=1 Tax=Bidens hawaiensis TaxID=980011 RepID=UPI004049D4B6
MSRAKAVAEKKVFGEFKAQYGSLRDYTEVLVRSNPGTTVKLDVEPCSNPSSETRQFRRIYICFGALKEGFKLGGRYLLGPDGCFLKEPYLGQILTAFGIDASNGVYPVAYLLVEAETTASWTWFFECLGDDLDLYSNSHFTFISGRQKKCAFATTPQEFERGMKAILDKDKILHDWLKEIPPRHWSRAYFSVRPRCDILLNNLCEVFNRQLILGRDKLVITCLEFIREYLMRRMVVVHKNIAKSQGPLTPVATGFFEKLKNEANNYTVIWNRSTKYQVTGPTNEKRAVDMEQRTCSCRRWELSGIP